MNTILQNPIISGALITTIMAILLFIQSYFQEKIRQIQTKNSHESQAEVTSTKVVEKLANVAAIANSEVTTPRESPVAKAEDKS